MLRTLHGDPNLGMLIVSQQPILSKFMVLSISRFKPKTMCHLLGPNFLVFALTNWAKLRVTVVILYEKGFYLKSREEVIDTLTIAALPIPMSP